MPRKTSTSVPAPSPAIPPTHKRKAEEELSVPRKKSTSVLAPSPAVPLSPKRKAEEELPVPRQKSLTMSKEGRPSASPAPKVSGIEDKPNLVSKPVIAERTKLVLKNEIAEKPTLLSKPEKPNLNLNTSTATQNGTSITRSPKFYTDPNAPPPKRGSYRELMSRKASDMPKTQTPVYTGKQIKEAAKRAKRSAKRTKSSAAGHRAPSRRLGPGPDAKPLLPEEKQKEAETHKRIALKLANEKFPPRAYKGTGAAKTQTSSEGTTKPVEIPAPRKRVASTISPTTSSADTSSNDMEAGYLDVEEEETRAALSAKKEDEEEARLESELRRIKERRKKRLALDASAKK